MKTICLLLCVLLLAVTACSVGVTPKPTPMPTPTATPTPTPILVSLGCNPPSPFRDVAVGEPLAPATIVEGPFARENQVGMAVDPARRHRICRPGLSRWAGPPGSRSA